MEQEFVRGSVTTPVGQVPRISTKLEWRDRWGTFEVRWAFGRMHYTVEPGLYAAGEPTPESPILVTANYKLSFDSLRASLDGIAAWVLVLDTKGINVWCAAGKGTFGTEELVSRVESIRLAEVVGHRRLILPQLAGPGVAAHTVKKLCGFRVVYGPIRAVDIKAFIEAGFKATPRMRHKTFDTWERTVLIPVELVDALKTSLWVLPAVLLIGGLGAHGSFRDNLLSHGLFGVAGILTAILAGAVLTPILLPWLPGRAFSVKGSIVGVVAATVLAGMRIHWQPQSSGFLELAAWLLIVPAAAAYMAMNFTGASTYTSLSGVRKEMRVAVPLQIGAAVAGVALWLGSRFLA
jgi:hypothetical protein